MSRMMNETPARERTAPTRGELGRRWAGLAEFLDGADEQTVEGRVAVFVAILKRAVRERNLRKRAELWRFVAAVREVYLARSDWGRGPVVRFLDANQRERRAYMAFINRTGQALDIRWGSQLLAAGVSTQQSRLEMVLSPKSWFRELAILRLTRDDRAKLAQFKEAEAARSRRRAEVTALRNEIVGFVNSAGDLAALERIRDAVKGCLSCEVDAHPDVEASVLARE